MFETILVCILAGIGAGFGTGVAGLSAAAVISPMLITFLHVDPYLAVGIALSSDVLASASSAWVYGKQGNLDVRNGLVMMFSVMGFTLVGSYVASFLPTATMGGVSMIATLFMGIKFLVKPVTGASARNLQRSKKRATAESIGWGAVIGMICGIVGAGGGMMMLLVLVMILGYELKTAVGTSVFIMSFTALTGAISHFALAKEMPDILMLVLCVVSTLVAAHLTAKLANKASTMVMNRMLGVGLLIIGGAMILVSLAERRWTL